MTLCTEVSIRFWICMFLVGNGEERTVNLCKRFLVAPVI